MPTKTLIITSEFPPQPGGIGNHAYNLAKGFQENNYQVQVLCDIRSQNGLLEKEFDQNQSFKIIRVPRKKIIFFSYIKRIVDAHSLGRSAEVIICSGKFSLWLGGFLSLFFKRKYIAIIHGSELTLKNYFLKWLSDLALKRFNKIIAVSNYTKSLIFHLNLTNVEVIPNGFSQEFRSKINLKNKPIPVLITVGNVTQRKGQHNVIKALPLLLRKFPDLKYHIVGIPTEKKKLEKLALDLKVENAVVFFGKVSENEKSELLQQADVFVMLSEKTVKGDVEGFGIAILEANALGIPAIGALGCGIEDAIMAGVSGKLVNNKNPEELRDALHEILKNYDFYSQNAKTWSQSFTWNKIIQRYLKFLKT